MSELERWLEERIDEASRCVTETLDHPPFDWSVVGSFRGQAKAYREVLEWVRSRQPVGLTSEMRLRTHGAEPTTGEGE